MFKLIQKLLLTFGAGAMLFGGLIGYSGMSRESWIPVPATVVDVATECHMEATERGLVSKTKYTKTIPCEDVELFKAIHADKDWSWTEYVVTTLDVGGPAPARATLSVLRSDKPLPVRGQHIEVLQNPAKADRVVEPGTPGREMRDGLLAFLFGIVLLGGYVWNRRRAGVAAGEVQADGSVAAAQAPARPMTGMLRAEAPRSTAERLNPQGGMARAQSFGQRR